MRKSSLGVETQRLSWTSHRARAIGLPGEFNRIPQAHRLASREMCQRRPRRKIELEESCEDM